MSQGWSIYVIFLAVLTAGGCLAILTWTTKMRVDGDDESNTTGHVWDGNLVEGNNPLPSWWLYLFWLTGVFMVIYLVIYPGAGNLSGTLGWSQVKQYEEEVAQADQRYGDVFAVFADIPLGELAANPEAVQLGRNIYMNHCATCHGSDARGAKGFPNLTAGTWLYGGEPETIEATITNGRNGVMPALGAALGEQGLDDVVAFVMSLSGRSTDADAVNRGREKYMMMCIGCHGPTGTGMAALGAANLTDDVWLHGAAKADIRSVILNGRMSQMPAQSNILNADRIRTVVAFVLSLNEAGSAGE
jgi:cytochrome c oxidase cbb3-type subunit III